MFFWRKSRTNRAARRRWREIPHDLSPHLLRDIGFDGTPHPSRIFICLPPQW